MTSLPYKFGPNALFELTTRVDIRLIQSISSSFTIGDIIHDPVDLVISEIQERSPELRVNRIFYNPESKEFFKEQKIAIPSNDLFQILLRTQKPYYLDVVPRTLRAESYLDPKVESLLALPFTGKDGATDIVLIQGLAVECFSELNNRHFEKLSLWVNSLRTLVQDMQRMRLIDRELRSTLDEKAIELKRTQIKVIEQQRQLSEETRSAILSSEEEMNKESDEMIGKSPVLMELLEMTDRVASSAASIFIVGESGTGKELLSRRIHEKSSFADGPYIALNCASLNEQLLESELFGHEKGSFTGAIQQKTGLCELANGGTLFLDEVGEMSLPVQTKLLRFLQESEFYRVGGKKPIKVSVRIISATNKDIEQEVKSGRFREDLYYRLNTISLRVPSLRERADDIALLCQYFLKNPKFGGLSHVKSFHPDVLEILKSYDWPGNIRELQNTIERMKILSNGSIAIVEDIPLQIRSAKHASIDALPGLTLGLSLENLEKTHILRTLDHHHGNKTRAAQSLGITIKTLYNKLHRYGSL